jgi:hypothetical protein
MEMNRTHKHPVYVDDVNILVENINTINKNREAPLEARVEVGPEVNTEKTKCIWLRLGTIMQDKITVY